MRTEFELTKPVKSARLSASGLGIFDLHLNGRRVSDDLFDPGWTDYTKRVYYRTYDVTEFVRQGNNAWGAVLADGWYSGYVGYGKMRNHYGSKPRFGGELHVEFMDGTTQTIQTGPDWKAATGPILAGRLSDGRTVRRSAGQKRLGPAAVRRSDVGKGRHRRRIQAGRQLASWSAGPLVSGDSAEKDHPAPAGDLGV